MDRINQFEMYSFGKLLRELTSYHGNVPATVPIWPLWQSRDVLQSLIAGKPFPLGLSASPAHSVISIINDIFNIYYKTRDDNGNEFFFPTPGDAPIAAYNWDILRANIQRFETIFGEEMKEAATYFVPRRGIYSTPALVDSADETFPADVLAVLPDKAKADWKSAGRCLAFNLLSASGFHVARAVEAVLELYYQTFSGKAGRILNSWNDYIKELEAIIKTAPNPSPAEKTIAEIKQMKDDYRNPIMHPRVILSEGDSRMLFANGESLIIAMAQEIATAKSGIQPKLQLLGGTAQT
jgi:hypothetical protein